MKLFFTFLLFINFAFSLPHFSLRSGNNCQSCHVNPTGKGMRNPVGMNFAKEELKLDLEYSDFEFDNISQKRNEQISIGFDARTLFYYEPEINQSYFLQMQGDIYFDFQLNKKFRFYFDKGLYNNFETFILAKILPFNGYTKIGQFTPSFGIKTDAHKTWTRSETGFGMRSEDVGVEFGFAPDNILITTGVFNGEHGGIGFPTKTAKAIINRFEYLLPLNIANLLIGASYYRLSQFENNRKITNYFSGFSFNNNFTFMIEFVNKEHIYGNGQINSKLLNCITNYEIIQGVDLRYQFETKTNVEDNHASLLNPENIYHGNLNELKYTRHSFGLDFYPMSGVEIRPIYIVNLEPVNEIANNELQIILHFYY